MEPRTKDCKATTPKNCLDPASPVLMLILPPLPQDDMALADLILSGRILAEMRSCHWTGALAELLDLLVDSGAIPVASRELAFASLILREEQRSTGIGNGVAIPHCFLPGLEEVVCAFGRSNAGIDFHAIDHVPVRFVLLFIVPEAQQALHLQTLASVARYLRQPEVRQRLADALDATALFESLRLSGITP